MWQAAACIWHFLLGLWLLDAEPRNNFFLDRYYLELPILSASKGVDSILLQTDYHKFFTTPFKLLAFNEFVTSLFHLYRAYLQYKCMEIRFSRWVEYSITAGLLQNAILLANNQRSWYLHISCFFLNVVLQMIGLWIEVDRRDENLKFGLGFLCLLPNILISAISSGSFDAGYDVFLTRWLISTAYGIFYIFFAFIHYFELDYYNLLSFTSKTFLSTSIAILYFQGYDFYGLENRYDWNWDVLTACLMLLGVGAVGYILYKFHQSRKGQRFSRLRLVFRTSRPPSSSV